MNSEYYTWKPQGTADSNISAAMLFARVDQYRDFYHWSDNCREEFWAYTVKQLGIIQKKPYERILNIDEGIEQARWLFGSTLNIVESCFQADDAAIALVYQEEYHLP